MIQLSEIQRKSREGHVRDQQIEKDYILSWILRGIAQHGQLSKAIVFKGGTVLKKVYFKNYRFSEDLDFTLLDDKIKNEQLLEWFRKSFDYVLEESNIRLAIIGNSPDEGSDINFYISYVGPLGGQGSNKKVKVDISRSEKLEFKPMHKKVLSAYTDLKEHTLLCYTLEEVLIEKMRAVMQRMQARDFYDLWYLLEVHGMNGSLYVKEFANKCKSKGLVASEFPKKLLARIPQYQGRWQSSISEQIQDLPAFDKVERETLRLLKKLKL